MFNYSIPRALALAATILAVTAPASYAGTANAGLPSASDSNPLGGMAWGGYRLPVTDPRLDPPSAYFNVARTASDRSTFDRLLRQPRFKWFGDWIPAYPRRYRLGVRGEMRRYIRLVTGGDPRVGVGVGVFRLKPFEHQACRRLPSRGDVHGYRAWMRQLALGIGGARTAVVLQPDMPFTLCLPVHSQVDLKLIAWTSRLLSALPHTTVYIDAGAADWMKPEAMASMLKRSGVAAARGFALNLTHYDSTAHQVAYGHRILRALRRRGLPGKHFVVNTAQNGRPFTTRNFHYFQHASVCSNRRATRCITLGHPASTHTGDDVVDAYLWPGRPWIANTVLRAYGEVLDLVRTSPFF